jgi:HrpA-like RNA helicase
MLNDKNNFLDSFEAFVLDEAHELRKSTMIILAILKNYLSRYPEKKARLIVTSATLDTDIFMSYFRDLKSGLVSAETPTHSVQVFYTFFPDLSSSILENTLAHLKLIFEVY